MHGTSFRVPDKHVALTMSFLAKLVAFTVLARLQHEAEKPESILAQHDENREEQLHYLVN